MLKSIEWNNIPDTVQIFMVSILSMLFQPMNVSEEKLDCHQFTKEFILWRWEAILAKPHSIQSRFIETRCFKPPRCGTTCIILFILCITDANDAVSIYECVEYVARCLIPKHYSWILKYGYYYTLLSGHSSLHHRTLPLEVWKF